MSSNDFKRIIDGIFQIRERTKNRYATIHCTLLQEFFAQLHKINHKATILTMEGKITDTEYWCIETLSKKLLEEIDESKEQNKYWQNLLPKRH